MYGIACGHMSTGYAQGSKFSGCVIGCNSYVGEGCELINTLVLGNDTYTNDASRAASREKGEVVLGIGA